MAINLLPSEQKLKFKKQKSNSGMQSIEMTGPKKVKKHKSSVKSGGVLGFFKQAFITPKVEEKKAEEKIESTSIKAPAKKILFKEKITFKVARPVPKVEYQIPERKPKSLDQKESLPIKNKISSIFYKPKVDSRSLPKNKDDKTKVTAKEQFPKYHSVNTEQLFDKKNLKTKKVRIIEVVSENGGNKNSKKQKQSIWNKIQNWLNNIFGNKKSVQPAPDPAKISGLSGFPKPKDGKLEISYEKKILREEQEKQKNKKQYIAPKIDQTKKIFPDQKILSYDKSANTKEATFVIEKEIEKIISPKVEKTKDLYIPPVAEKQMSKAKKKIEPKLLLEKFDEKKPHKNYFNRLSNFWKSFLSLFSKTKKVKSHNKSDDSNFMTQVGKNTEVVDEVNKSVFNKIDFNKPKDESETAIIKKEIPIPPIIDNAPSPSNKDLSNIHETIDDHKIKMTSVIENINIPSPLPPSTPVKVQNKTVEEKENIDKKEAKEEVTQTKGVSEEIVGLDWEVNLIPEDEQEKNIPVSKILYLIMSVVVAGALVFGGWLWANYYYNTITTTIGEIDAEISIKEAEIARYSQLQEEARITQSKILSVQELLDKHIYWSEFFNKLEFYTITDVYYSSMSVDVNGVVTLSAVGSSYENAVKQLMVMEQANDFVTKVTISDITFLNNEPILLENQEDIIQAPAENINVTFNINLEVQPEIFYYPKISL